MTEEQKRMTADEKGKAKEETVGASEENRKLLLFCQRIVNTAKAIDRSLVETKGRAFVDRLHAGLPKIPASASTAVADERIEAGETEESAIEAYLKWANRVRFEYCDLSVPQPDAPADGDQDQTPHFKFYFNNEARMLANSDIPKRSLAIAKEVGQCENNTCACAKHSLPYTVGRPHHQLARRLELVYLPPSRRDASRRHQSPYHRSRGYTVCIICKRRTKPSLNVAFSPQVL